MKKEFVSYEQALALKELGFDEKCAANYYEKLFYYETTFHHPATMPNSPESCLAPLKQQVFRWFREKYEVYPTIMTETADNSLYFRFIAEGGPEWLSFSKIYYTYEEAEDACIDKLIELAKQQVS
jgi:hypothetical protein